MVKVNSLLKDLLYHKNQDDLPTYANELEKYKIFLDQLFNVDITQMTDHHNGLDCVNLV